MNKLADIDMKTAAAVYYMTEAYAAIMEDCLGRKVSKHEYELIEKQQNREVVALMTHREGILKYFQVI